ncbi:hypothetical protein [Sinorhizobium fredii]|uniref:hypothetical protein n=1 Tax=Rhizobium fredii TaxID=380 RepID=UPI0013E8F0E0|nr:hypothetical protein [Sinorhizobium fredii]
MDNILAKRMSDTPPAKQTGPYGALGSAAPDCFAPLEAVFSRPQRSHRRQLDQDKFVVPFNPQRLVASHARDQIGTVRGIRLECMRAIVGIRTHLFIAMSIEP